MTMQNVRWYDKIPQLKEAFELIKGLDTSVQEKIAEDIIQILINDFNLDLDEEINDISKNYNYKCNRWYDKDINFFSAFEIIKNLPDGLKEQVVNRIYESLMIICLEENKNNDQF